MSSKYPDVNESDLDQILAKVKSEVLNASLSFGPIRSTMEAYGIITEEYNELSIELEKNQLNRSVREAIQLAAMCLRYIHDITNNPNPFNKAVGNRLDFTTKEQ